MKTVKQRFIEKVADLPDDGCWNWSANKHANGYGQFQMDRRNRLAHRVSYELFVGEIPAGMFVMHRCDNRACVRPSHLTIGTAADNMRDKREKGRAAKGENNGRSKLTERSVIAIRERYAKGGIYQRELAEEFNTVQTVISDIVRRKKWTHI
jgi:hypothetical protein